jgi:hypothetical protein
MKTPQFVTHYYLPETGPLRSLSDLPSGSNDPIFEDLLTRHQRDSKYRRRFSKDYLIHRRMVENRLRELFIARGGKPKRKNPFYFVLGESLWFKNLNAQHQELKIDISKLDPKTASSTYPDSFISLTQKTKPFHGQIFLLHEIEELVCTHGLPCNDHLVPYDRYWETDFELYIEVQIWDDPESILGVEAKRLFEKF